MREIPDIWNPSLELTKTIMMLAKEIDVLLRRVLGEFGLTVAEADVLSALRRAGEPYRMKPKQLARSLMLSSGGTTNVTHRLVAQGLVVREDDAHDGRSTWLRLTPEGIEVAERAVGVSAAAAHKQLFSGASVEALDAATAALSEVIALNRSDSVV